MLKNVCYSVFSVLFIHTLAHAWSSPMVHYYQPIAFVGTDGNVYLTDLYSHTIKLTDDGISEIYDSLKYSNLSWSSTGDALLFSDSCNIYVLENKKKLRAMSLPECSQYFNPYAIWSADGNTIYYVSLIRSEPGKNIQEISEIDVNTGDVRLIGTAEIQIVIGEGPTDSISSVIRRRERGENSFLIPPYIKLIRMTDGFVFNTAIKVQDAEDFNIGLRMINFNLETKWVRYSVRLDGAVSWDNTKAFCKVWINGSPRVDLLDLQTGKTIMSLAKPLPIAWLPNSNTIIYSSVNSSNAAQETSLWKYDLTTRNESKLFEKPSSIIGSAAVSPKGDRVVFTVIPTSNSLSKLDALAQTGLFQVNLTTNGVTYIGPGSNAAIADGDFFIATQ